MSVTITYHPFEIEFRESPIYVGNVKFAEEVVPIKLRKRHITLLLMRVTKHEPDYFQWFCKFYSRGNETEICQKGTIIYDDKILELNDPEKIPESIEYNTFSADALFDILIPKLSGLLEDNIKTGQLQEIFVTLPQLFCHIEMAAHIEAISKFQEILEKYRKEKSQIYFHLYGQDTYDIIAFEEIIKNYGVIYESQVINYDRQVKLAFSLAELFILEQDKILTFWENDDKTVKCTVTQGMGGKFLTMKVPHDSKIVAIPIDKYMSELCTLAIMSELYVLEKIDVDNLTEDIYYEIKEKLSLLLDILKSKRLFEKVQSSPSKINKLSLLVDRNLCNLRVDKLYQRLVNYAVKVVKEDGVKFLAETIFPGDQIYTLSKRRYDRVSNKKWLDNLGYLRDFEERTATTKEEIKKELDELSKLRETPILKRSLEELTSIITQTDWLEELENNSGMGLVLHVDNNFCKLAACGFNYRNVLINDITTTILPLKEIFNLTANHYMNNEYTNCPLILKGRAVGNGNCILPLYIHPLHWRMARQFMGAALGFMLTRNPMRFTHDHLKFTFMILLEYAKRIINTPGEVNEKNVNTLIYVVRTCKDVANVQNYIRGLNTIIKKYPHDAPQYEILLGEILTLCHKMTKEELQIFFNKIIKHEFEKKEISETSGEIILNNIFGFHEAYSVFMDFVYNKCQGYNKFLKLIDNNYGILPDEYLSDLIKKIKQRGRDRCTMDQFRKNYEIIVT